MNFEKLSICFIGSFIGAALSVWFGYHWGIGMGAGLAAGIVLTVWREIMSFILATPRFFVNLGRSLRNGYEDLRRFFGVPLNRLKVKSGLCKGIAIGHSTAWFAVAFSVFIVFVNPLRGNLKQSLTEAQPALLIIGLCLAGLPLFGAVIEAADSEGDLQVWNKVYPRLKRNAIRFNFICLPFTLMGMAYDEVKKAAIKADLKHRWADILYAIHSRSAIPMGIFCALGAGVGCLSGNPIIGGLAGMAFGAVEAYVVKRLLVPRLSMQVQP